MHRFKVNGFDEVYFWIDGEEFHHLAKVLRLQKGDKLYGFDASGRAWLGRIELLAGNRACCRIEKEEEVCTESAAHIYLIMGLAKGEKMEWVVQKGTELGMAGFIPLRTERSVVRLDEKKGEEKVRRWQKIAGEAVKQCGRVREPQIFPVSDWRNIAGLLPAQTRYLLLYEEETQLLLRRSLQEEAWREPVALLVGAEGGFAPAEARWAKDHLRAEEVSLGPRILRTETAAVSALALALFLAGELG